MRQRYLSFRNHGKKKCSWRIDPLVKACTNEYAMNLLGVHDWTLELAIFVLGIMDSSSRYKCMRFVRSLEKPDPPKAQTKKEDYNEDCDDQARELIKYLRPNSSVVAGRRKIEDYLNKYLCSEQQKHKIARFHPKLRILKDLFRLNDVDIKVLCLFYCCAELPCFMSLCNDLHSTSSVLKLMALATGERLGSIQKALFTENPLRKIGILDASERGQTPFTLDQDIRSFLAGLGDKPLVEKFCKKDTGKTHMLDQFNIPAQGVETLRALLAADAPCNILLYGQSGTGKTEFARSLAASLSQQAFFVQYAQADVPGKVPNRRLAIQAATGAIPPDSGILVVDEADSFLNTRYFMMGSDRTEDKGWHNSFLDKSRHKIIWIVNETAYIEESTMRRFSYSLRFRKFTRLERHNIWQKLAKKHPLRRFLSPDLLKELAGRYQANAAGIASALTALKTILPSDKAEPGIVQRTLADLLERHLEATGHDPREKLNHLTGNYDIEALNTDTAPEKVMHSLKAFADYLRDNTGQDKRHVNLLFWGSPGTGKTEFAKFLADQLSMGLLVKRASDMLNPYVGVTEMLIRDTFEEAERERSILFIDEADSMFINRETATRSWETAQTNELLTQMENFRGILICCTNLLEHLDAAVVRRFAWKIEFKPLADNGKIRLFEKYFLTGKSFSPEHAARLTAITNLTAGDFKAVWDKYQFLADSNHNQETLIEELQKEVAYRKGHLGNIGFKN